MERAALGGPPPIGRAELNPTTPSETTLDCRTCGACCRGAADGRVLVSADDLNRWRREGAHAILSQLVPGHFSQQGFAAHPDGACVHLGMPGDPHSCSIYETRAESCHALEVGSAQCLDYRRMFLIE
jgi:Fe-S-cluster containining protein